MWIVLLKYADDLVLTSSPELPASRREERLGKSRRGIVLPWPIHCEDYVHGEFCVHRSRPVSYAVCVVAYLFHQTGTQLSPVCFL